MKKTSTKNKKKTLIYKFKSYMMKFYKNKILFNN